jgi:hypothetical protein
MPGKYRYTSADIDSVTVKFDALQKALAEFGLRLTQTFPAVRIPGLR